MSSYSIENFQESQAQIVTDLLNAAYFELAELGLNYTAASQGKSKTLERISKGRCFVLKNARGEVIGTILITIENYCTGFKTAYIGQFGLTHTMRVRPMIRTSLKSLFRLKI